MMSEKIEMVLVKRKMSKSALAEALNSSPSNLYKSSNVITELSKSCIK